MQRIALILIALLLLSCASTKESVNALSDTSSIHVSEKAQQKLGLYYRAYNVEHQLEFAFCVYGDMEENSFRIADIQLPPQKQQQNGIDFPHFYLCDPGIIAWGHSHYFLSQGLSGKDKKTFFNRPERYTVLIRQNLKQELILRVWRKHPDSSKKTIDLGQTNLGPIPDIDDYDAL